MAFRLILTSRFVVALQYDPNWQELVPATTTPAATTTTTTVPTTTTTTVPTVPTTTTTLDTIELGGSNDGGAVNVGACGGECDGDEQCVGGLYCFQRDNGEAIPGCHGPGDGGDWDYCVSAACKRRKR